MNARFDVPTSRSLLEKLRALEDHRAWSRFLDAYLPMIEAWGQRFGLSHADSEDVAGRLLAKLVEALPLFRYEPDRGSFRGWLKTVTQNELANFTRERRRRAPGEVATGQSAVHELLLEQAGEIDDLVAGVHDASEGMLRSLRAALQDVEQACAGDERKSWDLFERIFLNGQRIESVAAETGLSYHATAMRVQRIKKKVRSRAVERLGQHE